MNLFSEWQYSDQKKVVYLQRQLYYLSSLPMATDLFTDLTHTEYFHPQEIHYPALLKKIKKHPSPMQPLFEAISNSFEATSGAGDCIIVKVKFSKTLSSDHLDFVSFEIQDSGVGFNDDNYKRLKTIYDDTKGYNNLGTGRLQFLHSFHYTIIESYFECDGSLYFRKIYLSKFFYCQHKAVIWESCTKVTDAQFMGTKVTLTTPLNDEDKQKFSCQTTDELKQSVLTRYLSRLCLNRDNLQEIRFEKYVNDVLDVDSKREITSDDIPKPIREDNFSINYSYLSKDFDSIITDSTKEDFCVTSFELSPTIIKQNLVKITSKGEAYDVTGLDFSLIKATPRFRDGYVLFLVSSDYLTNNDSDLRGSFGLYSKKDLLAQRGQLFDAGKVILCDDIQDAVISTITTSFPEINEKKIEQEANLDDLAELFSLDRKVLNDIGIQAGESDQSILKRVYQYNAEVTASQDANIKNILESLDELDPSQKSFESKFDRKVKELSELVPPLMRKELTQYVSRRKLVLDLMHRILDKTLSCFDSDDKHHDIESLLHSLIFSKKSSDSIESNLWMINDDFIHFKGFSEHRLLDIEIDGEKFIREDLTAEQLEVINSFGKKRLDSRPDILLFPSEHKCVIIELKTPDKDVSAYISQVTKYASLIRKYCKDQFEVTTFYAYLIGDNFSFDDIIDANPYFRKAYYFDYVYNPDQPVNGGSERKNGEMYIEVITYSTLLERAALRNRIFIDKIANSSSSD